MRRLALAIVACCTFAAIAAADTAFADAKAPNAATRALTVRPQPASRPAQIPKVRRVKKGTEKLRGGVTYRPIKIKRKLIDLTGSVLARCGESGDYVSPATPVADDSDSIDDLEIESVSYDPVFCDDQKKRTLFMVIAARVSVEELVYPSETHFVAAPDTRVEAAAMDVSLRIRLLPKLPDSSSEDGSALSRVA